MLKGVMVWLWLVVDVAAWWDNGHMLVGEVATQRMQPADVETIQLLLRQWDSDFPNTGEITTASIWPDLMKCNSVVSTFCPSELTPSWSLWNAWHYVNLPVPLQASHDDVDAVLATNLDGAADRVLLGILQTLRTTHSPWTANQAVRLFIHIFGDVHNPLHAAATVSSDLPKGDLGGNALVLDQPCSATNLHAMWDSIAGVYGTVNWTPDMDAESCNRRAVVANATRLLQAHGNTRDPVDFGQWRDAPYAVFERHARDLIKRVLLESHDVAERVAYAGLNLTCERKNLQCHIPCPSAQYQRHVIETAEERIVVGGMRLSLILTQFARQIRALQLLNVDAERP
ncbi:hypothetical protein LEN26_013562 [Aphanomyces euteiches]|nr:hypothetical protein AeMF1_015515 [Aphanomyces euteiches]KAH9111094.1 hypothetical protein LEN26_013562 [Aphanomyces euteiches]KAH9193952.1 hypothetical protein AeNC1_004082 [Aphanomyces euteiches]